ncbi:MAG TPA: CarD family transcriptional regulator [Anaerolineales bacterium]|nr:CarD family transcriptional regulator [Anaerolineales bacterium]
MTTIEQSGLKFEVGDKVVHPQHGVGYIEGLEEKQFEPNNAQMYYVVSIPDTTLWVPVDFLSSGLRKLGSISEINECQQVLTESPEILTAGRDLLSKLFERINIGSIIAHCEVIRDLTAFGWKKPLYGPIADFQRMALQVLCQEWAMIKDIPLADASQEINQLLKRGRAKQ